MAEKRPRLLAIDTATKCAALAVTSGTLAAGEVMASLSLSSDVTHSRRIISCVDYLFSQLGIGWQDLDGIAVGLGPGSFTGLRIGMATAKGFAFAAKLPLFGVATHDGIAASVGVTGSVWVTLDARKKQIYAGKYSCSSQENPVLQGSIQAMDPEEFVHLVTRGDMIAGDGVTTYGSLWRQKLGENVRFAPQHLHRVSAAACGLICGEHCNTNNCLDLETAEPLYVRASDAELNLIEKKQRL